MKCINIPWTFFFSCMNLNLPLSSLFFTLGIFQLHCELKSEFRSSITSFHHCFHLQHREYKKYVKQLNLNHVSFIKMEKSWFAVSLCNKCRTMYVLWPMFRGFCGMGWEMKKLFTSFELTMMPWLPRTVSFVDSISCKSTPRQQSSIKTVR